MFYLHGAAKDAKGFDGLISSAGRQQHVFDLDHVYCDEARRIAANDLSYSHGEY
jgi:hypothetical protein